MIPQQGKAADAILAFFYGLLRFLPSEWASNMAAPVIALTRNSH